MDQPVPPPPEFGEDNANTSELVSLFAILTEFNSEFPVSQAIRSALREDWHTIPNFIRRMTEAGLIEEEAIRAYMDINGGTTLSNRHFAMEMAATGYTDILERAGLALNTHPGEELMPLIHDGEQFVRYLRAVPHNSPELTTGLEVMLEYFNEKYPNWVLFEKLEEIVARHDRTPHWIDRDDVGHAARLVHVAHRPAIDTCAANSAHIAEQMERLRVNDGTLNHFRLICAAEQEGFGPEYAYLHDLGLILPQGEHLHLTYTHWSSPQEFTELDTLLAYIANHAQPFSQARALISKHVLQELDVRINRLAKVTNDPFGTMAQIHQLFITKRQEYASWLGTT